jgi:hypothetical protein
MTYIKYQRTLHLPWSPGATSDDKILDNIDCFIGREVVGTFKKDGENTSLYPDYFHARSIDSRHHPSRDWLARFHAEVSYKIPDGWRICGENLYAQHSIAYTDLPSYFMGFSIWNEENVCLDWDTTLMFFEDIGITPVETIYRGIFDEKFFRAFNIGNEEGYVVRLASSFKYDDFQHSVAKYVRKNHVQTDEHWAHSKIIPNGLKHD